MQKKDDHAKESVKIKITQSSSQKTRRREGGNSTEAARKGRKGEKTIGLSKRYQMFLFSSTRLRDQEMRA